MKRLIKKSSKTLYHGTSYTSAKKIIASGFIYPSLSDEVSGVKDHLDLAGYENLMNGVYLTDNLETAMNFGGGGAEQMWKVVNGEYVNVTCGDYCVVLVFDNIDTDSASYGEKTLNYLVFDKDTKQWTGQYSMREMNPYSWEDLKRDDPEAAEIAKTQIRNTVSIDEINKEIEWFLTREGGPSVDFVIPNKIPISEISSIKIFYDYEQSIDSSVSNLDKDIELIRTMQHPDINWEEIIN